MRIHPLNEKKYFIVSAVIHAAILLFFVISFDSISPIPVLENTNQHDVMSAVILGDIANSKILPIHPATPKEASQETPKAKPEKIIEKPKQTPLPPRPTQDAIALSVDKQQKKLEQVKKDKLLAEKMQQNLFGKDLLADIQQEKLIKQKQAKQEKQKKQAALQSHFKNMLQEQTEKTLRQSLLNEEIKLHGTISRQSQGEINKYKALMMQAISEQWLVPMQSDKQKVTELQIRLARNGNVLDVQITKSSGDASLDSSARAAVMKASPLPVPSDSEAFEPFRQFILKAKPENLVNS